MVNSLTWVYQLHEIKPISIWGGKGPKSGPPSPNQIDLHAPLLPAILIFFVKKIMDIFYHR